MPLVIHIEDKTIGRKHLFQELRLTIDERTRVGLIGRNGTGKTTLFNLLSGKDHDFKGSIEGGKNLRIVATEQEHFLEGETTALDYVLDNVRDYRRLMHIMDTYPDTMGEDLALIHEYTEAISEFGEYNYYGIEDKVADELAVFGLDIEQIMRPISTLSGGQRRFVELVKVLFSNADLILLDEPTNHMDYVGKAQFLEWLDKVRQSVLIISHDRDVLETVDRIVEVKDRTAHSYPGNYTAYLRQNSTRSVTEIGSYETSLKELKTLEAKIKITTARKAGSSTNAMRIREERLMRERDAIKSNMKKPSFWIDQESVDQLDPEVVEQYNKYKTRNIRIAHKETTGKHAHRLLEVSQLSAGYTAPLFSNINFYLAHGDRLHIKGRNGAGKSTLVRLILQQIKEVPSDATIFHGEIKGHNKVAIGLYEQEIDPSYLTLSLGTALEEIYAEAGVPLTDQLKKAVMSTYLFDPILDQNLLVKNLSGGQKARLQIIRMLCGNPNVLILDEPTNHLDLPSIEELEQALIKYDGAILFVSHDSFFVNTLGGETVEI
ncbi:MAG: ABC-F family ATP-binding cassette domain-containing protein [bacterium]